MGYHVSISMLLLFGTAGAVEKEPVWHQDWAKAREMARKANKPIFVVFR